MFLLKHGYIHLSILFINKSPILSQFNCFNPVNLKILILWKSPQQKLCANLFGFVLFDFLVARITKPLRTETLCRHLIAANTMMIILLDIYSLFIPCFWCIYHFSINSFLGFRPQALYSLCTWFGRAINAVIKLFHPFSYLRLFRIIITPLFSTQCISEPAGCPLSTSKRHSFSDSYLTFWDNIYSSICRRVVSLTVATK